MRITFDPTKRAKTLAERGLDFEDAALVFSGTTVELEDLRKDYDARNRTRYI
ncbi:MAG: BrnT family toxin [Burkholderiales bacterium]